PGDRREVERGVEPAPVARVGGRVEAPLEERRVAGGEREAHRREARGPPRLLDPVAEDQARAGRDVDLGRLALLSGRGGAGASAGGSSAGTRSSSACGSVTSSRARSTMGGWAAST